MEILLPFSLNNVRGSVVMAVVATLIVTMGLMGAFYGLRLLKNSSVQSQEKAQAQLFASELMEFFLSISASQFLNQLTTNPEYSGVKLCSYYNMPNADHTLISNPSSWAALPSSALINSGKYPAARYFKVEVMDFLTQVVRTDVCDKTPPDILPVIHLPVPGKLRIKIGETFKLTVGVIWYSKVDKAGTRPQTVELVSASHVF